MFASRSSPSPFAFGGEVLVVPGQLQQLADDLLGRLVADRRQLVHQHAEVAQRSGRPVLQTGDGLAPAGPSPGAAFPAPARSAR